MARPQGAVSVLNSRIKTLERKAAQQAASVNEPLSTHFQVAVSCPPSTVIHVRGGNIWQGSYWVGVGAGYYYESYDADFSDPDTIEGYIGNFVNANYYIGVIFGRELYGLDHYIVGGTIEYPTAAEAEAHIETVALASSPWQGVDFAGGLPLCGLVLRNDGRTGTPGAVLPIDRVNRGRSYYWKDLRPRHYVTYTT